VNDIKEEILNHVFTGYFVGFHVASLNEYETCSFVELIIFFGSR